MNILNIFAALLGMGVSIGMIYGLWNPMNEMINYLPTEIMIFVQICFIMVVFLMFFIVPIALVLSDD